jgi:hypothetical protein
VGVVDGTVTVRLERVVALPLTPPGWPARTRVTAEASSQLRSAVDGRVSSSIGFTVSPLMTFAAVRRSVR